MGDRIASWFAVLLMGVVLLTSYWYAQTLRTAAPGDNGRIGTVDFFAQNVALTGFDSAGRPRYRLFADRMTHFGNSDDVDMERPRLLSIRPDQPRVQATALVAHATNNAETIQMVGDVVLTRAADGRRAAMRLTTEELTALPDQDRFWTASPVRLESGAAVITARGMDFDNLSRQVVLRADVAGTFPPRSQP
jgi:lipopolysaccharide export system protein LptC